MGASGQGQGPLWLRGLLGPFSWPRSLPGSLALLTCSASKREGELTVAQGRVKDLESLFHRSEAELAAALSDKRSLESDVAELQAQLAKVGRGSWGPGAPAWRPRVSQSGVQQAVSSAGHSVSQAEDGHAVAKKQLEKETLMRVDLENRCQSLQEELDFQKSVFEEVSASVGTAFSPGQPAPQHPLPLPPRRPPLTGCRVCEWSESSLLARVDTHRRFHTRWRALGIGVQMCLWGPPFSPPRASCSLPTTS